MRREKKITNSWDRAGQETNKTTATIFACKAAKMGGAVVKKNRYIGRAARAIYVLGFGLTAGDRRRSVLVRATRVSSARGHVLTEISAEGNLPLWQPIFTLEVRLKTAEIRHICVRNVLKTPPHEKENNIPRWVHVSAFGADYANGKHNN